MIEKNRAAFKERFSQFRTTLANFQLIQKGGFCINFFPEDIQLKILESALGHSSTMFTKFVQRPITHSSSSQIFQSEIFEILKDKEKNKEITDGNQKLAFLLTNFSNGQYTEVPQWLN